MPSWSDISLKLYKEFSEKYLIPNTFRYHLEDNIVLDVGFTDWSIYHLLGIQHINGKISKKDFFRAIERGLDFDSFFMNESQRKRLFDYKYRIRAFGCIYKIMKSKDLFYVKDKKLLNSDVKTDYIKYELVDNKGINVGIRSFDEKYIVYTMLISRSSNPSAIIRDLTPVKIEKMEIIHDGNVIETIEH